MMLLEISWEWVSNPSWWSLLLSIYAVLVVRKLAKSEARLYKQQLGWIIAKLSKTPMTPEDLYHKHWDKDIIDTKGQVISNSKAPKRPRPSDFNAMIGKLTSEYRLVSDDDGKWRSF